MVHFTVDDHPIKSVLEALSRYDLDTIMTYWAEECSYDNPMVVGIASGKQAVREKIQALADGLQEQSETVEVDRVTVGPAHAVAEWHIEPGDGSRKGIHVAETDEQGLIEKVTVYPRV